MVVMSIIGTSSGKPAIEVSRAVARENRPSATMPISAEVPPTSKVMTRSRPQAAAVQAPPSTPAAGPDNRVSTGRSATMEAVATPPLEPMTRSAQPSPSSPRPAGETVDVVAHLRPHEGVHRRGGEALELAELRGHLGGSRDESAGMFLGDDPLGPRLVPGVDVGEEEAHRDGLDALGPQGPGGPAHPLLVQRLQLLAPGRRQAAADRLAVAPPHQRPRLPGDVLHDRIVLRPLMAADMQNVPIAAIDDHAGPGAVVLQHGIGGDGGAVEHGVDAVRLDALPEEERADALEGGAGRVVGRGRDLVNQRAGALRVREHDVGKGAANIHADKLHPRPRPAAPGGAAREV